MSKKKKKDVEKKSLKTLKEVDKYLDHTYDSLQEEIEAFQIRLNAADFEARKKIKKYKKKHKYVNEKEILNIKQKVRNDIVGEIEASSFLDRVYNFLDDVTPVILIMAELVKSLICSILSMDIVKHSISSDTLVKFDKVYKRANSISG